MKRPWNFLENPFERATDNSYRMAVRISTHLDSALNANKSNAFIMTLYTAYHLVHLALIDKYNTFIAKEGLQQGETLNLRQLLRLLSSSKIGFWDSSIQVVYPVDTPQYTALLPNGRKPFQTGTQTERMAAVQALGEAIGTSVPLATLKSDVEAFYIELSNANTLQKGSITVTRTLSDEVDAARIAMCQEQYSTLGAMMSEYKTDTSQMEQYFDLEAIRRGQQVFFTGSVKQQVAKFIVKRTFTDTAELKLDNPGVTQLKFYLAENKTALPNGTFQLLEPGESKTVNVTALGLITNTYLMSYNPDDINKGEFDIEIL